MGISVRRCALIGERSALMPMLTSDPRSSFRAPSDAPSDAVNDWGRETLRELSGREDSRKDWYARVKLQNLM